MSRRGGLFTATFAVLILLMPTVATGANPGVTFARAPGAALIKLAPKLVRRGGTERVVCAAVTRAFAVPSSGGSTGPVEPRTVVELPDGASPDWCLVFLSPRHGDTQRISKAFTRLGRRFLSARAVAGHVLDVMGTAEQLPRSVSPSRVAHRFGAKLVSSVRRARAVCHGKRRDLVLFARRRTVAVSACSGRSRLFVEQNRGLFTTNFLSLYLEIYEDGR